MNERVQALRELSVTTQPHIDMERAKSETATYKKYEGQLSVPELRAQVLYDYFATKTLYIGDGELIVGEREILRMAHRHSQSFAAILLRICTL